MFVFSFGAFGLHDGSILDCSLFAEDLSDFVCLHYIDGHGIDLLEVVSETQGTVEVAKREARGPELLQACRVEFMATGGESLAFPVTSSRHTHSSETLMLSCKLLTYRRT